MSPEKSDHQLLVEIHAAVVTLQSDRKHDREDLDELRCEIFGNGHDGLKRQVNEHLVRHDEQSKLWKALVTISSGSGLSGLVAGLVAYFRA